jgi:phosphate transport system substrate-binding protein
MLLVLGAGLLGTAPAAAATTTLKVTPANGLVAGQWVMASWSSVSSGTAVYLRQCTLNPITIRDCGYLGPHALRYGGVAPGSGEGSLNFPVAGVLNAGSSVDRFTCDNLHACSIALFTDPSATNLSKAVFDPISFAVSSDSCPSPLSSDTVVSGQGTFTIARAFRAWEGRLCRPPNLLHVTYHATTSLRGESAFVGGNASFAMTSQPLSHTSITTLASQHRRFAYAPMIGSALVFGFRMADPSTGETITSIKLTASQLAAIFTGQLQDLNADPDIVSQNPGVTFPPAIRAIGRADPAAQSRLLTSWFLTVARHTYRQGGPAFSGGPTDTYPQSGTITLLSGAKAVAGAVADPNADPSQLGTIGWMDSSVAALYDLPSATVENNAGDFVDAAPASMRAGILAMRSNPDGVTRSPRFLTKDANAYPLPVVTYLVAQTSVTQKFDKTKADVLRRFIRFAVSPAHSRQNRLPDGYVSLPTSMSNDAQRAANQLPTRLYVAPTQAPSGTSSPPSTGSTFTPFTPSGGGAPPPTSTSGAPPSGFPAGSGASGFPTGVLPPNTLASEGTSYAWPLVLIIGIALIVLGTALSAALRVASGRGAKRALAGATPTATPEPPESGEGA